MDGEGNLFVYLCRRWHDKLDDTSKISALVHEAAHHAGPGDITYNRDDMKALPQSEQLNNAASYQNFAEDVATSAWGCAQAESITDLPFECEPAPCRCPTFVSLCDDATWGAQIRKRCPATCGECIAPPDVAPAAATTTTTTTAASTTTTAERPPAPDCSEPDGAVNLNIGKRNWRRRNSCRTFSALGYCGYQEVEEACPLSLSRGQRRCVPMGVVDSSGKPWRPPSTVVFGGQLRWSALWQQRCDSPRRPDEEKRVLMGG